MTIMYYKNPLIIKIGLPSSFGLWLEKKIKHICIIFFHLLRRAKFASYTRPAIVNFLDNNVLLTLYFIYLSFLFQTRSIN